MPSFVSELRRRNVLRVAAAYALVSWILIEAGSVLLPTFGVPEWFFKVYTNHVPIKRTGHLECRATDTATDIEYALAPRIQVLQHLGNASGPARRHVTLAPDQLEHGYHVVVIFVFVFHDQEPAEYDRSSGRSRCLFLSQISSAVMMMPTTAAPARKAK